jgi:hypothetical protein
VKFEQLKILKGKLITKIKCGARHYFAFERKKKLLKYWNNSDVLQWAEEEGFEEYLKILKVEKVTGEKLLTMDETYMEDVLGMTLPSIKHKINLLVQELNANTDNFEDYVVHSWGKNDKGQLCVNPSASVATPVKLKLPEHTELFACFGDQTFLRNTKTQQITMNTLDEHNKLKWEPLTSNKVWALAGSKQTFISCQSVGEKHQNKNSNEQPISKKKEKLRTAKSVMNQIQWDTNLEKQ